MAETPVVCEHGEDPELCEECNTTDTSEELSVVTTSVAPVAEVDLDDMVRAASIPNLASLFRKGKDAGLIKPGKEYGEATA